MKITDKSRRSKNVYVAKKVGTKRGSRTDIQPLVSPKLKKKVDIKKKK